MYIIISRYEARPPKDIKFVPLNQVKEYDAQQLMELYSVSIQINKLKQK